MYRRTQTNRWLPLITLPSIAIAIWAATHRAMHGVALVALIVGMIVLVATTVIFSSLTVAVTNGELRFHFGFGVWTKRYRVAELARVAATRSAWWEGLGIRVSPRGWLYTVAIGPAVEVTPRGAQAFRLGTPEPEAVIAAIDAERGAAAR